MTSYSYPFLWHRRVVRCFGFADLSPAEISLAGVFFEGAEDVEEGSGVELLTPAFSEAIVNLRSLTSLEIKSRVIFFSHGAENVGVFFVGLVASALGGWEVRVSFVAAVLGTAQFLKRVSHCDAGYWYSSALNDR